MAGCLCIVFADGGRVCSIAGHPFSHIKNAYIRVVDLDAGSGKELMRFQLNGAGNDQTTALLMCKIHRADALAPNAAADAKANSSSGGGAGRWKLKAIGHATHGQMYKDNIAGLDTTCCCVVLSSARQLPQA